MVSIFVCCWLPLNVINVTNEYVSLLYESRYFLLTFFAAHVVAMSSTVYNPFLYADPTRPAPPRRKPRLSCVRACVTHSSNTGTSYGRSGLVPLHEGFVGQAG